MVLLVVVGGSNLEKFFYERMFNEIIKNIYFTPTNIGYIYFI